MEDRFTIGEVARLLGKDRKTIERWMKRASMEASRDTQDGRYSLVTREQAKELARVHHLVWPEERRVKGAGPQVAVDALATLEQRVKRLEGQMQSLEQRLRESAPVTPSAPRQVASPAQPIQRPPRAAAAPPARKTTTPPAEHPPVTKGATAPTTGISGSGFPPGLESWRVYAKRHGLSPSTVQEARDKGKIPVVQGSWWVDAHEYKEALDAEGQQKFWEKWGNRPDLQRCQVPGCLCAEYVK